MAAIGAVPQDAFPASPSWANSASTASIAAVAGVLPAAIGANARGSKG